MAAGAASGWQCAQRALLSPICPRAVAGAAEPRTPAGGKGLVRKGGTLARRPRPTGTRSRGTEQMDPAPLVFCLPIHDEADTLVADYP